MARQSFESLFMGERAGSHSSHRALFSNRGRGMKTRIHVNQHNIKANSKGEDLPVLTVKDYKQNRKCNAVAIVRDGEEIAKVVYSPNKPLPCGAKVWIETEQEVVVK